MQALRKQHQIQTDIFHFLNKYANIELLPSRYIWNFPFCKELMHDLPKLPRVRLVPMEYGDGRGNGGAN